ncbi:MAG: hypothetical protein ACTSO9_08260 [Candidatus Helarchaeota archaeon]
MIIEKEKPKDHDFIQTIEDFLFCVIGYSHPKDRIISYLKYVPHPDGKWRLGSKQLKRVMNHYSAAQVLSSHQYLGKTHNKYVYNCPISKIQITAVPINSIKKYYRPQRRVKELFDLYVNNKTDLLQTKTIEFIEALTNSSQIKQKDFGITGSILTDSHNINFSDIDLTVHGRECSKKIQNIIEELFEEKNSQITRLKPKIAEDWRFNKMKVFNFTKKQSALLYSRKWNMGHFKNTRFSIHPIRNDDEILEKYGDLEFFPKGIVEIEGKVINDDDSIFLPCKYDISDVDICKGEKIKDIEQVCSYEGLFCFVVKQGERFRARGKLEEVVDKKKNRTFHRLLIGSYLAKSRDFILPITD